MLESIGGVAIETPLGPEVEIVFDHHLNDRR